MRITPTHLILITLLATSCEKGIITAPPAQGDKVVVEGIIENGRYPMVILSRNTDYFSPNSPSPATASFVHGAKVTVSSGAQTHQLREYKSDATTDGTILYFYTVDTAQLESAFTGERTLSYTLKIEAEGKTMHAITTIPASSIKLDSMWWTKADGNDDLRVKLLVKVTDPPQRGNYVRYFTSRNSGQFLPGSVFNDEVANGTSFEMRLKAGIDKKQGDFDANGYFTRGDTVTLKFCNVDHSTYDFWRSADDAYFGNGSTTFIPNTGNIQGGLGYWGGYGVTYKTIIIPK